VIWSSVIETLKIAVGFDDHDRTMPEWFIALPFRSARGCLGLAQGVNPPVVVLTLKPEMLSELLLETNRYSLLDSVLGCIANDVGSDPVGSYTGLSRVSAPDEVVMRYPNTWLESSHNT